jgi:hypothetical protein
MKENFHNRIRFCRILAISIITKLVDMWILKHVNRKFLILLLRKLIIFSIFLNLRKFLINNVKLLSVMKVVVMMNKTQNKTIKDSMLLSLSKIKRLN